MKPSDSSTTFDVRFSFFIELLCTIFACSFPNEASVSCVFSEHRKINIHFFLEMTEFTLGGES
jgi:hypothetical protein